MVARRVGGGPPLQPRDVVVVPGRCWWCGNPADSREHKFKRTDLIREHGPAPYTGEATLGRVNAAGTTSMRSNKSSPLKFEATICQPCNNVRSQASDYAYDRFIQWVHDHEVQLLDTRGLDLHEIFGDSWSTEGLNVLRYFVKHMCCRIAELGTLERPEVIPADVISFLDGGRVPRTITCELFIEPAMLRWCEMREDDPLWSPRPLWLDPLWRSEGRPQTTFIQSRWRYGWLTLAWALGQGATGQHPFSTPQMQLPFIATMSDPTFEFVLARGKLRSNEQGVELLPERLRSAKADEAPLTSLDESPIAMAFVAAALDFEAGVRRRAPDERRNDVVDDVEKINLELEVVRARMLVSATQAWASGELEGGAVHSAAQRTVPEDVEELKAASAEMAEARSGGLPVAGLRTDFACMASLQLADAMLCGPETAEGQDALLAAARFAGKSAIAAGLAAEDLGAAFDSVLSVAGVLACAYA